MLVLMWPCGDNSRWTKFVIIFAYKLTIRRGSMSENNHLDYGRYELSDRFIHYTRSFELWLQCIFRPLTFFKKWDLVVGILTAIECQSCHGYRYLCF